MNVNIRKAMQDIKNQSILKDENKEQFKENITKEYVEDIEISKEDEEINKIVDEALKEAITLENEGKEVNKHDNECCLKVRNKLQDIYEINKDQDHKLNSLNKVFFVVFLAGVAFGMSDAKWLPYASWLWEFGKDIIGK